MDRRDFIAMVAVGAGVSASVAASAAAQDAVSAGASHLHQILERGVLRVGTTGDFNPMSFRDTTSDS